MNKKWTLDEEEYLRDNVNMFTDEQIAIELTKLGRRNVTMLSVRKKRQKLGLKKAQGRGYCKLLQNTI